MDSVPPSSLTGLAWLGFSSCLWARVREWCHTVAVVYKTVKETKNTTALCLLGSKMRLFAMKKQC